MNNKGVTLEAEIPLYWISEKSNDPILHVTPGEKKKKISQQQEKEGKNKFKSSPVQTCDIKMLQLSIEQYGKLY